MPINAGYEYINAEKEYLDAKTLDEKVRCLEEMIRVAPKHKSSEKFVAELKTRLIKFREKNEKAKKKSGGKKGLRKEGFQFILVGLPNSGKSSLLGALTNAKPAVTEYGYSTRHPEVGTFFYEGVKAQIVDLPSIGSETFDVGIIHTADCVLIVVDSFDAIAEVEKLLTRAHGKKLYVITKSDLLDGDGLRKAEARLKSKRIHGTLVSVISGQHIMTLKEMLIKEMGVVRVYMKEPGKAPSPLPAVLPMGATVKHVAEAIRKGFSSSVKGIRLTGPSGKFANQKVGLTHKVSDRDIVEFHT